MPKDALVVLLSAEKSEAMLDAESTLNARLLAVNSNTLTKMVALGNHAVIKREKRLVYRLFSLLKNQL
jgi:hypothetical protein